MSLGEELSKADPDKVAEIFDDVYGLNPRPVDKPNTSSSFLDVELTNSEGRFSALDIIETKINEVAHFWLLEGIPPERIKGIYTGFWITRHLLSLYVEREIPDAPPPEL